MKEQFEIYSVDTKAFYTERERSINSERFELKRNIQLIEDWANHKYITKKTDISLEEYKTKSERMNNLKRNNNLNSSEEVEIKELKEFFKKIQVRKKKRKPKEDRYKTAQEKKVEKNLQINKEKKMLHSELKSILADHEEYKSLCEKLSKASSDLDEEMNMHEDRYLNDSALNEYNKVSLFDNSLSRATGIKRGITTKIIIVRAYHYKVLEQLIENGFIHRRNGVDVKYRIFTASAGQIRTKKVIFIEEEVWNQYEKTLMCGLTIDDINNSSEKGCNINKFLAYLALCNSATDEIKNFDIDKAIVIDDFETNVRGVVDYIDNKTFEESRQEMDILIPHSDGCGWVSPTVMDKNFMVRLPWVKGLVTPVDYIGFCDEYRDSNYNITDIYGKVWNLKNDDIQYVFTKSQFKMWKYYPNKCDDNGEIVEYGWDKYVKAFKEYNCKANMCNLEGTTKEFKKANFNYQMWQTLTDITDEEISDFTDVVDEFITNGYSDRKTMLKLLGADEDNTHKTNLQKCIEIYPELIRDYHVREELASMLNARKKEAKYGKFKINGKYTFLIPDVFAWMENVFLGIEVPKGLLEDGEVSCKLFKGYYELLLERSPHLYAEHCPRNQVLNENTKKWFLTNGVYTSSHDLISKVMQFDK